MTAPALAVDTDRPTRCAFIDPDLFQTDEHGHYPVRLDQLRRLCTPCYARRACLATALADPTLTGFWGGFRLGAPSHPARPTPHGDPHDR